jgi:hypothetical protein
MARRRKHKLKECEDAIREAEERGWRVDDPPKGYYRLRCPCEDKHMKWVHRTPSDPNWCKNLLGWLQRQSCWDEEERP